MRSSLFLHNITVIDHAVINPEGRIVGGSFNASFEVTGEVIGDEAVVVDFSRVKSEIKHIIDDNETGFDHKLWIIHGWSGTREYAALPDDKVHVITDAVYITAPSDAVIGFEASEYSPAAVAPAIARLVEANLARLHPGLDIKVKCILNTEFSLVPEPRSRHFAFTYSHGLRNSTSYGCQNIAHGHLSFLQLEFGEGFRDDCDDCRQALDRLGAVVQNEWDGAVLIDPANIADENDEFITVAYKSLRGTFVARYAKMFSKYKILPAETTIENIVDAFAAENHYWLERAHVKRLSISEGLTKGAYKEFEDA